jgi:hypothetical protein
MGMALQDILERKEILLKHNDMNTQEYKIKGWVARDQNIGEDGTNLYFGYIKPKRLGDEPFIIWVDFGDFISLPKEMFPELSFDAEPIEVELTIKKI